MSDPDHHAAMEEHVSYGKQIQDLHSEIERLRASLDREERLTERKLNGAAAFLDWLASRLEPHSSFFVRGTDAADECRTMAKRLRGET